MFANVFVILDNLVVIMMRCVHADGVYGRDDVQVH